MGVEESVHALVTRALDLSGQFHPQYPQDGSKGREGKGRVGRGAEQGNPTNTGNRTPKFQAVISH